MLEVLSFVIIILICFIAYIIHKLFELSDAIENHEIMVIMNKLFSSNNNQYIIEKEGQIHILRFYDVCIILQNEESIGLLDYYYDNNHSLAKLFDERRNFKIEIKVHLAKIYRPSKMYFHMYNTYMLHSHHYDVSILSKLLNMMIHNKRYNVVETYDLLSFIERNGTDKIFLDKFAKAPVKYVTKYYI